MNIKQGIAAALATVIASAIFVPVSHAAGAEKIAGSTAWGPCTWSTSNNVRYTSAKDKQVKVRMSETGKLGVKIRTINENTGAMSAIQYFPPLNQWKNLGKFGAKNTPFRLSFSCVNERGNIFDKPSTSFVGSLDY